MRLVVSVVLGLAALSASYGLGGDLEILLTYDVAVGAYLVLLLVRMTNADPRETWDLAERKETTNRLILSLAAAISASSLGGVALMLHRSQNWSPWMTQLHVALSIIAVFLSWVLLHSIFAMHYARLYYAPVEGGDAETYRQGLDFPEEGLVDFWDFLYYSFTIAICYQTSDVTIRSREMRRLTLAHAVLSFLNVTVIIGLVVEIVSTLVSASSHQ
jgi:uncharacterized membrane protein